ncbi:SDR family oxidoreductase [Pseudactinotalea sp. HY160]|uniref:SDR family NAD(P)-dependent oxidoreductase n=1 Tax=Pseudactinotalea sp. HY160 TaxID=2654490 RepID=UPI00128B0882|nr:SDR family oxidoreductase [Pseudactinotalea sp. HY160]MPV51005.1 SDR family oxidoreductase [Pseudactinotalea sp. HY160]
MPSTDFSALFAGHFTGRRVVIMGGARGIGADIGEGFARAGASVLLTDLTPAVLDTASALNETGLDVTGLVADATDEDDVAGVFAHVRSEWGSLDVLVNNAGIITISRLEETSTEDFAKVLAVNTTAQFLAAREALPLLRAAGGGSILNAASGQAREGFIFTPSYAASKFGVMGMTQSLAKELAPENIRVNAYCPGIVETEMWEYNDREWGRLIGGYEPGEYIRNAIESIPLGRAASGADIAHALMFLASDAGTYITGQALNIDGGMFMN